MPSTTDLGLDKIPNEDQPVETSTYESFKAMSDSLVDNNQNETGPEITNKITESTSSSVEDSLSQQLESNPIVNVSNGEELDILVKMERANK